MNTIITPTGSYNWVFMIKFELQMGYKPSATKRTRNYKSQTSYRKSLIIYAAKALLSPAGYKKQKSS